MAVHKARAGLEAGGKDAGEGRIAPMKEDRQKAVLRRVAEPSGRGGKLPEGRARDRGAQVVPGLIWSDSTLSETTLYFRSRIFRAVYGKRST